MASPNAAAKGQDRGGVSCWLIARWNHARRRIASRHQHGEAVDGASVGARRVHILQMPVFRSQNTYGLRSPCDGSLQSWRRVLLVHGLAEDVLDG